MFFATALKKKKQSCGNIVLKTTTQKSAYNCFNFAFLKSTAGQCFYFRGPLSGQRQKNHHFFGARTFLRGKILSHYTFFFVFIVNSLSGENDKHYRICLTFFHCCCCCFTFIWYVTMVWLRRSQFQVLLCLVDYSMKY